MCGIAGAVSWRGPVDHGPVEAMTLAIRHRGPDDRGIWSAPNRACAFGHARLSILDLSPAGHQPMIDRQSGNAIVFNGEIYNFQALRRQCEAMGDVFTSLSDTEVILALYRHHGVGCLAHLRGMFAFAIWDEKQQSLFLARDRVGKKPLNYAITPSGVVFCSELGPLSRHPGVDRTMDTGALELYLQCHFIPAPWSIYRGVRKLPPAHYAVLRRDGTELHKYWDVDYRTKVKLNQCDALDAFEETLTEAVRLRMIADVPVGALLSGGVDSSVVVALMAKVSREPVRTFSIGFEDDAFNELPWAQQAAARFSTIHHPEIVHGDVRDLLPSLARHYGEPFADSSAVPSFFVSAAARRHVTVALNGDGGDELLGGYTRYSLSKTSLRVSALVGGLLPPGSVIDLAVALETARGIPQRAVRKLLQHTNPEMRWVLMYAAGWNDRARRELLAGGGGTTLRDWRTGWLSEVLTHADNPVERMLWLDNHTYLAGDLMVKMDIASMHCGLETRSPLLDHKVIEFCAALPTTLKVHDGVGKYLLKKLAERFFPRGFVHRRKMGFGIPLATWLRGPLNKVLHRMLNDRHLMAPLALAPIQRTLREFEGGRLEHESRLWCLLMFGHWREQQGS